MSHAGLDVRKVNLRSEVPGIPGGTKGHCFVSYKNSASHDVVLLYNNHNGHRWCFVGVRWSRVSFVKSRERQSFNSISPPPYTHSKNAINHITPTDAHTHTTVRRRETERGKGEKKR